MECNLKIGKPFSREKHSIDEINARMSNQSNSPMALHSENTLLLSRCKMAETVKKLTNSVNNLDLKSENCPNGSPEGNSGAAGDDKSVKWGFPLQDLYKLGLKFYKDKEGKAINLTYQNKLKLVAYSQQITHGAFSLEKTPPVGVLDVIGRDRRDAWQALGNMSKEDAMKNFIDLLDSSCPLFKPFVEAQKADLEEKLKLEEERRNNEMVLEMKRQEELRKAEEESRAAEERKRQIQDALNAHTFQHFKAYAEEQYPGNPEQQAVLVRQLQEQHYHQYMQQLMQQQQTQHLHQQQQPQSVQTVNQATETEGGTIADAETQDNTEDSDDGLPRISPPSMWTRKDIKDFKESIRKEGGDAIIKVGHGETVTVRVPTHEDGTCLFWEFATDSYDIGFGVYFEWSKSTTNQVSVHIQDSEDEDDLEEDDELDEDEVWVLKKTKVNQFETLSHWVSKETFDPVPRVSYYLSDYADYAGSEDVEKGSKLNKLSDGREKPLLSAIVPIYRRDCQDEVYAGSHMYPGEGVYLLKFDNSYSLWRSKTLYYRVYYTR